jgi:hypothetical protein
MTSAQAPLANCGLILSSHGFWVGPPGHLRTDAILQAASAGQRLREHASMMVRCVLAVIVLLHTRINNPKPL